MNKRLFMTREQHEEFHNLLMDYRGAHPEHAPGAYEAILRWMEQHETRVRDDECAQIMSGCRITRRQTMHDYLDKRIAKRASRKP